MRNQRYKLRYPGSSKRNVPCPNPNCKAGDNPSYTVFLDSETNELCSDEFGYCNKCEYIKFPSDGKFNYQKSQWTKYRNSKNQHLKKEKVNRTLIPNEIYKNWTIKKDDILPNFFDRLKILDDTEKYQLCRMYGIGIVPYCPKHLILPYISIKGEIMTAQIKFFDRDNKTIENGWIHQHRFAKQCGLPNDWRSRVENRESSLTSCMMGEHLLKKYSSRNVVIHESLKNALYYTAKVGLPKKSNSNPVQLATGSKSYLSFEKIKNITTKVKRNLVFIPDPENKAIQDWTEIANRVQKDLGAFWNVEIIDLRTIIPDLKAGYDIADYLDDKWNAPDFVKPAPKIDTVLKFQTSQSISNNSTPELRNAKGVDLSESNQLNDTEATTEPVEVFVEIEDFEPKAKEPAPFLCSQDDLLRLAKSQSKYRAKWIKSLKSQFNMRPKRISKVAIDTIRQNISIDTERMIFKYHDATEHGIEKIMSDLLKLLIQTTEPNLFSQFENQEMELELT